MWTDVALMSVLAVAIYAAGWAAWIVFFDWAARYFANAAKRRASSTGKDRNSMLDGTAKRGEPLDPAQKARNAGLLCESQWELDQLSDPAQQRYEGRMGDLMGMAGGARVNRTAPRF